jgi:hypothetical protein
VNAAGLVQGIALVTFPAASTILANHSSYDLSRSLHPRPAAPRPRAARLAPVAAC